MTASPRPKAHPAVVAAAVLFVAVVCGLGAVQLLSQVVDATLERTTTLTPATARVVVDTEIGDVTLTPSTDGRVHVHTTVRHGLGEPRLVEESTPDGVRLDVDCQALTGGCEVDHVVALPPAFEVVVDGSFGDVTVSRLTGPVTVDRVAGDISVFHLTGPLALHSRMGEITGRDLRAELVQAETGTGDVRLELLAAPRALEAESATGEVDVAVPGDVSYRVDARSGSGVEQVLVPVDQASPRTVRVDGGDGDVRVHPSR